MLRRLKRIGAVIGVGAMLAVLAQTPAHAASPTWYYFADLMSAEHGADEQWAIRGGTGEAAGQDIILWHTDNPAVQDHAWVELRNADGTLSFRNGGTANWFAMSVQNNSKANGAHLVQWWYESGNPYEEWTEYGSPYVYNGYGWQRYANVGSGKCIAISGTNGGATVPGDGAQIVQWTCGSGHDQYWFPFYWDPGANP